MQELLVILVTVSNMGPMSVSRCTWVSDMVWCVENLVAGPVVLPCA